MALLGLGIGMMMQNLVLCTQNQVDPADLGAASSVVAFFRSLGGAIGVSVLGALLAHRVKDYAADGFAARGIDAGASGGNSIPDLDSLPAGVRTVLEAAYGNGIADVFLFAAPAAAAALLMVLFIKEVALKTRSGLQQTASVAAKGSDPAPDPAPAPALAEDAPTVGSAAGPR
jgi:hypothetical protein